MSSRMSVVCKVHWFRKAIAPQTIGFNSGSDLKLVTDGQDGLVGISDTAADLLDVAAAVYQIERQLSGRHRTNPPERFELRMKLRKPKAWTSHAIQCLREILRLLGNAEWELDCSGGVNANPISVATQRARSLRHVALLSGGLDSTCGAATLRGKAQSVQLVSFYTRQKHLQRNIAFELGYYSPIQWRMLWAKEPGRGHSFYYRSFLFLAIAAVTAECIGVRSIFQFENGILATAIPPTPAWMMTKHAHPLLQYHAERLFSALLGGEWKIINPFLTLTKKACVEQARKAMKGKPASQLLGNTQTCWYLWSNRIPGDQKQPGIPCGICIPCLVRRTAIPGERYEYDLQKDSIRNHPQKGLAFRSYYGFLDRVLKAGRSTNRFYGVLPAAGRSLLSGPRPLPLGDVRGLFLSFGKEFMDAFG